MSFVATKLRQDRFKIVSDAQAMINAASADSETMEKFDAMMNEADALMEKITRVERASAEAAKFSEIIGQHAEKSNVSFDQKLNEVDVFKQGFVASLRESAKLRLTPQDKTALENYQAAASVGTGSAGGYTVPTTLMKEIFAAMVLEGGMRAVSRILPTDTGNTLDLPMNDDTSQVASLVAENTSLGTAPDLAFSKVSLGAYKFTSGVALISKELLQDSAFNFEDFVQQQLVHRFTRGTNAYYTTGTGSNQPQGIVPAVGVGVTAATGGTTSITYANLVDLEHSVAFPYRQGASWMMSDTVFRNVKKLVDSQNRPLWVPNLTVGAPDSLLGYSIAINADLATPAANAKSLLFGDFKNFIIRDVMDISFQVLVELYAASGQIGVVGIMRTDSDLATVGAAIKSFAQSAT